MREDCDCSYCVTKRAGTRQLENMQWILPGIPRPYQHRWYGYDYEWEHHMMVKRKRQSEADKLRSTLAELKEEVL